MPQKLTPDEKADLESRVESSALAVVDPPGSSTGLRIRNMRGNADAERQVGRAALTYFEGLFDLMDLFGVGDSRGRDVEVQEIPVRTMVCAQCGSHIGTPLDDAETRFCGKCGGELKEEGVDVPP